MLLKRTIALILGVAFCSMPQALFACAVCGGRSDSALAQGMNMGILALLGVIFFVLSGVAAFGIYLARRSAAVNRRNSEASGDFRTETQQA